MQRKWEKELEGKWNGEKSINTRWSEEERRGGVALSLLFVTPSQLLGFMESFLSWCCFLIDIKMHWPVCQYSPSPSLSTLTPLFTLYLFNSPCLTDVGCHLHTVWRDRNGTLTSHLTSSCDGQQFLPVRAVLLVKPCSVFCLSVQAPASVCQCHISWPCHV